jgi:hypothetical protein
MLTDVRLFLVVAVGLFVSGLAACTPGYMKVKDLDRLEQGPKDCAKRCQELGMRMGALVLVSNDLPGCVCEPLPAPNAPTDPAKAVSQEGASAAVTGEVVIAAAAAAGQQQQQQRQRQQQQEQSYKSPTSHY